MTRSSAARWSAMVLVVVWSGTALADLFMRDPALVRSGAGALQAAVAAAIVAWPMTIALGAASTVRMMRPGPRGLIEAQPTAARTRMLVAAAVEVGIWSSVGLLLAMALTTSVATFNGSMPSASAWLVVVPAGVGTMCLAAVGAALGALAPSWVVPPLAAALLYLGYSLLPREALGFLRYIATDGRLAIVMEPVPGTLAIFVVILALLLASGIVALTAISHESRALLAVAVLVLAAGASLVPPSLDRPTYRTSPPEKWECVAISRSTSKLCLPAEQRSDLSRAAEALQELDARVANNVAVPLTYGPAITSPAVLPIPVPLGDFSAFVQESARGISSHYLMCIHPDMFTLAEDKFTSVLTENERFLAWLEPTAVVVDDLIDPVIPMDAEEAHLYLARVTGCAT